MKKRWLVVVVAVMVMVGLIFAVLSQLKEPPSYAATLSDGTIVRLVKVGVGMIPYDSYPPLKALVANYVPNRFRSRLGQRTQFTFNCQPHEIALMFLLRGCAVSISEIGAWLYQACDRKEGRTHGCGRGSSVWVCGLPRR